MGVMMDGERKQNKNTKENLMRLEMRDGRWS